MDLSSDLISQFVKTTNDKKKSTSNEATYFGTIVEYDGLYYVKIDGSEQLTPITTTADVVPGERVTVLLKNHSATVTGNISSPSARQKTVVALDGKVSQFGTILADKVDTVVLRAEQARIDALYAENATITGKLTANEATIKTLQTDNVVINEKITANSGSIKTLESDNVTIKNTLEAQNGTIKSLESDNVTINEKLNANLASIKTLEANDVTINNKLTAAEATISSLKTDKLSATEAELKYANIDFTNIGKAAMEYFYANSGLIKDVTIGDSTITGHLVGVTISGDLIEGNTIVAEKLVVKGEDGLYYKLNTDGMTVEASQTDYNSLNGTVIKTKSITASKISVKDLVAFDATIGGFHIGSTSLYSGVKSEIGNTTQGVYLDSTGQVNFGDSSNYLKYFKDTDGQYKLRISADSISFGSGKTSVESAFNEVQSSIDNIEIGTRNLYVVGESVDGYLASNGSGNIDAASTITKEKTSGFIAVTEGEELQFQIWVTTPSSSYVWYGYQFFKEDRTALDTNRPASHEYDMTGGFFHVVCRYSIIVPAGASYIRVSARMFEDGKIKVERGNKPTDWSPAPEDTDTAISAAQNAANTANSKANTAQNTANTANSTANTALNTANNAQNDIDNLEVGGRNLFKQSGHWETLPTWWNSNGGGISLDTTEKYLGFNTIKTTVGNGIVGNNYNFMELDTNKVYTYSAMIKSDTDYSGNGNIPLHYHCAANETDSGSTAGVTVISYEQVLVANEWKLVYVTFQPKGKWFRPFVYIGTGSRVFNIAYLKLELGNRATDWTPAPEDVDADIDEVQNGVDALTTRVTNAETSITQNKQAIELRATKTEVTTVSNTANTALSNAATAQSTANTAKTNAATAQSTANTALTNANAAQEDIDNLEIGGRNLLLKTETAISIETTSEFKSYKTIKKFNYSPIITDDPKAFLYNLKDGKAITLSYDVYFPKAYKDASLSLSRIGVYFAFTLTKTDGTKKYWYGTHSGPNYETNKHTADCIGTNSLKNLTTTENEYIGHYSCYTIPSSSSILTDFYTNPDDYTVTCSTGCNCEMEGYTTGGYIKNVKLELGNHQTDWTPAPEDLETRVTDAETKITQNADSITSVATRTTNVENKFANYSTTEQMNSAIEQKANSITSSVSSTYATKTALATTNSNAATAQSTANTALTNANAAQNELDNLEIGGRNYIRYGKGDVRNGIFKNFNTVVDGYVQHTLTSKKTYSNVNISPGFVLGCRDYKVGAEVVFSYDIMYTVWDFPDGTNRAEWWFGQRYTSQSITGGDTTGQWKSVTAHKPPVVGENGCELNKWIHVEQIITIPTQAAEGIGTASSFQFYNSNADITATVTFRLKNVKLEYGNRATDWTPAPEDIETRITSAESSITQLSNKITAEVTERTALATRVSTVEQTASGLTVRLTTAENGINTAQSTADAAKTAAANAQTTANTANSTANTAKTNAATAQSTANTAKTNAATAQSTANTANSTANTALTNTQLQSDKSNYSQLNDDTASYWGFTADSTADGHWYTAKTLARDIKISNYHQCNGGERFKISFQISTSVKGNSTSGGTDSVYRGTAIGLYTFNASNSTTGIQYSSRVTATASATATSVSSIVTIPTNARRFYVFVQTESFGNFSGTLKIRNVRVEKIDDEAAKTATNYLNFSSSGLVVGDMTASTLGRNILIDSDSIDIRKGTTVLASYSDNTINLGISGGTTTVSLCGDKARIGFYDYSNVSGMFGIRSATDLVMESTGQTMMLSNLSDSNGYYNAAQVSVYADETIGPHTSITVDYQESSSTPAKRSNIDIDSDTIRLSTYDESTGYNPYIYMNSYNNNIYFGGKLVTDNNIGLAGLKTDGSTVYALASVSSSNNIVLGYGTYGAGSGRTHLYGNELRFYVKTANTNYKPYFEAGDSITVTIRTAGYVTNGGKDIIFAIPLCKPILGSPTITVTSGNGFSLRQNNSYTHGSSASTYVSPNTYTASKLNYIGVSITASFTTTTNVTNNSPIGIYWNGTITFS